MGRKPNAADGLALAGGQAQPEPAPTLSPALFSPMRVESINTIAAPTTALLGLAGGVKSEPAPKRGNVRVWDGEVVTLTVGEVFGRPFIALPLGLMARVSESIRVASTERRHFEAGKLEVALMRLSELKHALPDAIATTEGDTRSELELLLELL